MDFHPGRVRCLEARNQTRADRSRSGSPFPRVLEGVSKGETRGWNTSSWAGVTWRASGVVPQRIASRRSESQKDRNATEYDEGERGYLASLRGEWGWGVRSSRRGSSQQQIRTTSEITRRAGVVRTPAARGNIRAIFEGPGSAEAGSSAEASGKAAWKDMLKRLMQNRWNNRSR
jgi:hypothetical protein